MPLRESVEQASRPAIELLNRLPRAVPAIVLFGLMVAATLVSFGWVLFLLVALVLAWILYLAWPRLTVPERMFRVAVLAFVLAITVTRAFPR